MAESGSLPSWRGRARRDPVVSIYGAPRLTERLKDRLAGRRTEHPSAAVPAQRDEPDGDVEHTVAVHLDGADHRADHRDED